jgi:phospholipase/carboxylesterase
MSRLMFLATLCVGCHSTGAGATGNKGSFEGYTAAAKPSEKLPLVVVIHGFGGTPDRIAEVVTGLRWKARVYAPRGIYRAGPGFSWFSIDLAWDALTPGIAAAADVLDREIAAEVASRPTCGKPIVVGFSQGAMLSYAIAARAPDKIAAALPLSGAIPRALWPKLAAKSPLRVTAFHGAADGVIDVNLDRETHAAFLAHGYRGELHVVPDVDHGVTEEMVVAIREQIEREIRDQGCAMP